VPDHVYSRTINPEDAPDKATYITVDFERGDAVARMEENTLIVQWVEQCLERRISSYRWGLERLVIQAPDNIAADADRLIGELAAQTANPPVAAQPVIGHAVSVRG